jgi:D-alanyl-D-alanine dipeptidase
MIHSLKDKPIVLDVKKISHLKQFYQLDFDLKDQRSQEKLVEAKNYQLASFPFYFSEFNPPYHHSVPGSLDTVYLREGVAQKLQKINQELSPYGIELLIFDGYRPVAVQNYFYFQWVPYQLQQKHPEADSEWIEVQTSRYWSKGATSKEELLKRIPPHSTGAAVDLTLRYTESKIPLEMGSIFDDISTKSHTDHFEKQWDPDSYTEGEAKRNRRLLHHLMINEDFVPHPFEWWHFSFGDQMWGYFKDSKPFYSYAGDQLALDFQD